MKYRSKVNLKDRINFVLNLKEKSNYQIKQEYNWYSQFIHKNWKYNVVCREMNKRNL